MAKIDIPVIEGAFALDMVGRWTDWYVYDVEPDAVRMFAEATKADSAQGIPTVFSAVPAYEALLDLLQRWLRPETLQANRSMHGAYDLAQRRPLAFGERLSSRGRVLGVRQKSTLTVSFIELDTRAADDDAIVHQYFSLVHPATTSTAELGDEPPAVCGAERPFERSNGARTLTHTLGADLARLYAAATGDWTSIHFDEQVAQSVGLPDTIMQGLCTLGVVSAGLADAVADGDPGRVRRLAGRFTNTVFSGDVLTTRATPLGERPGAWTFETSRGGDVVVGRAYLEVAEPGRDGR